MDRKLCPRLAAPLNIKEPRSQDQTILSSDLKAAIFPRPRPLAASGWKAASEMPDQYSDTSGTSSEMAGTFGSVRAGRKHQTANTSSRPPFPKKHSGISELTGVRLGTAENSREAFGTFRSFSMEFETARLLAISSAVLGS